MIDPESATKNQQQKIDGDRTSDFGAIAVDDVVWGQRDLNPHDRLRPTDFHPLRSFRCHHRWR